MDLETTLNRNLLRDAVRRQITCPLTGVVLDVRTSVLIDATDSGKGMAVVDAEAFDHTAGTHVDVPADAEILDGRELFG